MTRDNGLTFWLSYVESRGGLWESAGDSTLVMIPPQLQRRLELPEEFAVTSHPDVAREDGVALLGAGHPLLTAAAQDVLSADDAGVLTLASPASRPPDDDRLLAKARDQFPVDHVRIDASGPAQRGLRQVLRVGALVTYTASADEVFHERADGWVDVPSRQELPRDAVTAMRRFIADGSAAGGEPDLAAIPAALAQAHRLLDQKFSERCRVLAGGSARDAAEAELARAKKYYAEALASLARRQANATPDRRALLAARADSVQAEEKRRLAEIEEKYAARHEIRPYRLHLLLVPVLRLPVDVLRGARRFPLVLDWMLPARAFAPVNCPGCGADTARWALVAAKTELGCASCLSGPTPNPPAPAVTAPAGAAPAGAAPAGAAPALAAPALAAPALAAPALAAPGPGRPGGGWLGRGADAGPFGKIDCRCFRAGPGRGEDSGTTESPGRGPRPEAGHIGAAGTPSRRRPASAPGREEVAQRAGGEQGGRETGHGILVGDRAGQPAGAAAAVRRRHPGRCRHPAVRRGRAGHGDRPGGR